MKDYTERTESIKKKVVTKRKQRKAWITAAATLCAVAVLTIVCSIPIIGEDVPNINAYKNDEYYPLIEKINGRYYDYATADSGKTSIFQELGSALFQFGAMAPAPSDDGNSFGRPTETDTPTSEGNANNGSNSYEETTLNQVDGVTEADLLKRSRTHVFYLKNTVRADTSLGLALDIYALGNNSAEKITTYDILEKDDTEFYSRYTFLDGEMYLSEDASTITVITTCKATSNKVLYTVIISLDVSNPSNVTEVNRIYVSGAYLSSRKVDGKLLVITNFNVDSMYRRLNYDDKSFYVPRCGEMTDEGFMPLSEIYMPEVTTNNVFTVLALLDERTLDTVSQYALLSYSQDVYVSSEHIFVTRTERKNISKQYCYDEETSLERHIDKEMYTASVTDIVIMSYESRLDKLGCVEVEGVVKDRYSMDEKDGILRVVTTIMRDGVRVYYNDDTSTSHGSVVSASLYCVDIATGETVAAVEKFAPQGDEVKSARFDGDNAYVCTAVRNTDPVYFFDLSDPNNITYTDTGTIPGFSISLIKFGDKLLGIGEGNNSMQLKIEAYKQIDDADGDKQVVSAGKYTLSNCSFSAEYKAHFINAEQQLVGLMVHDYNNNLVTNKPNQPRNGAMYLLLRYDAVTEEFEVVSYQEFDTDVNWARAFYLDNSVYVFGNNGFSVINLSE